MRKGLKRSKRILYRINIILPIFSLLISIMALVCAIIAKNSADWVDSKQNNVIEKIIFNDENIKDSITIVK